MTAEIAILNKEAVAIAADSAITLSAGPEHFKVFDSADKLFELSVDNPIGVMIYNDMNFMGAPLPLLIRKFREGCGRFERVEDAANALLKELQSYGLDAPRNIKDRAISTLLAPELELISKQYTSSIEEFTSKITDFIAEGDLTADRIRSELEDRLDKIISRWQKFYASSKDASYLNGDFSLSKDDRKAIIDLVKRHMPRAVGKNRRRLIALSKLILRKNPRHLRGTGLVVTGFGGAEMFPSLISYELDGVIGEGIRYRRVNFVDIDRSGEVAKVIPFAQRDMVDRFVFGIDVMIQDRVEEFCLETLQATMEAVIEGVNLSDESREQLMDRGRKGSELFVDRLKDHAFDRQRAQSQAEIENLVEFMPKPEMARTAEALVNLTSIKRRVSRGTETVAGPIDVAVISRSEGFVWVKRKHYFPAELNTRYFGRTAVSSRRKSTAESDDAGS